MNELVTKMVEFLEGKGYTVEQGYKDIYSIQSEIRIVPSSMETDLKTQLRTYGIAIFGVQQIETCDTLFSALTELSRNEISFAEWNIKEVEFLEVNVSDQGHAFRAVIECLVSTG